MSNRVYDQVSADARIALTEFLSEFEQALVGMPTPWARQYGAYRSTRAVSTKWPIPLTAAGYQKFLGDPRYRTLAHKSIELIKEMWQDGVAELKSVVEAPDFFGWADEPQNMAASLTAKPNHIIAEALALGEATVSPITGQNFFSSSHPFNVLKASIGTFDNLHASQAVGVTALQAAKQRFREIKSASGESLGLRMTHLLAPPAQEEAWRDVLERNLVVLTAGDGATDNRHKGSVELIIGDELTEDDYWYPLALNKPGVKPWALIEGEREDMILGTGSALYEREHKVGFDSRVELTGGLILPHAIQRLKTTA